MKKSLCFIGLSQYISIVTELLENTPKHLEDYKILPEVLDKFKEMKTFLATNLNDSGDMTNKVSRKLEDTKWVIGIF